MGENVQEYQFYLTRCCCFWTCAVVPSSKVWRLFFSISSTMLAQLEILVLGAGPSVNAHIGGERNSYWMAFPSCSMRTFSALLTHCPGLGSRIVPSRAEVEQHSIEVLDRDLSSIHHFLDILFWISSDLISQMPLWNLDLKKKKIKTKELWCLELSQCFSQF